MRRIGDGDVTVARQQAAFRPLGKRANHGAVLGRLIGERLLPISRTKAALI
jgi:hypothetical protein